MKTYLTSISRSDATAPSPFRIEAENVGDAMVKSIVISIAYKPVREKAAFCSVNVYEMEQEEGV